ncbi:MAG: serine protease [Deltaproteobacteria bacterium]|nr:serine protease [Deltaproteobacteria bacterium]
MEPNQLFGKDTMNAPWGLASRLKLVLLACSFFSATNPASNHKALGKEQPNGGNAEPLTGHDFHITGTNRDGAAVAGTGLVVHPCFVLTCRHVLSDMKEVDEQQTFQGQAYTVNNESVHAHPKVDVAVMRVNGPPLSPLKGAIFQAPVVAQTVYTLGYPKLPGLREASVTMQQGAVTNQSVTSLNGDSLFLYSAVSRPGNSGGPVMSDDGYIAGLSIVDATGQYQQNDAFSPHYAGIPAQVVVKAVADLDLGIQLPIENYE